MLIIGHLVMRAFATLLLCLAAQAAVALDAQSINDAQWSRQADSKGGLSPVVAKAQILLDRGHFSPGEIDGNSVKISRKRSPHLAPNRPLKRADSSAKSFLEKADFFVRRTGPDRIHYI
jgi:hypothetical protein